MPDLWPPEGHSSLHQRCRLNAVGIEGNEKVRGPYTGFKYGSIRRFVTERPGRLDRFTLRIEGSGASDFVAVTIDRLCDSGTIAGICWIAEETRRN